MQKSIRLKRCGQPHNTSGIQYFFKAWPHDR